MRACVLVFVSFYCASPIMHSPVQSLHAPPPPPTSSPLLNPLCPSHPPSLPSFLLPPILSPSLPPPSLSSSHPPTLPSPPHSLRVARRALVRTLAEVARALLHLHSRGLVHGDLKVGGEMGRKC